MLFRSQKDGVVRIIQRPSNTVNATPFINVSDRVFNDGERGLLGMAFDPYYSTNGYFYLHFVAIESRYALPPDAIGDTVVARYRVSAENPDVSDVSSETVLFKLNQPFENHNGGMISFRPGDFPSYLYLALGDGGSGYDPNHNGQNLTVPLAKILRMDVSAGTAAAPPSNPFADGPGGFEDLTWVYGLRNPWRFSLDRKSTRLNSSHIQKSRMPSSA